MFSRAAPRLATTTGTPAACASTTVLPKVSVSLGDTNTSLEAYSEASRSPVSSPVKTTRPSPLARRASSSP